MKEIRLKFWKAYHETFGRGANRGSGFLDWSVFVITRRELRPQSSMTLLLKLGGIVCSRVVGIKGEGEYSFDWQANHDQREVSVSHRNGKPKNGDREIRQEDGKRKQTGGRTVLKNGKNEVERSFILWSRDRLLTVMHDVRVF